MIECKECGKRLKVLKHTHFKYSCSGKIASLSEYKKKFPNAETVCVEVRKKLTHSEESFITRYGVDEGTARWKEYRKKLSYKNTLDAFLERGKSEDDYFRYNKSRAVTLVNLIAKYGEKEGTKRFEEYRQKQRTAGNTLDYFVSKFGEYEGALKYEEVCKLKGVTLNNMIRIHGRDEGFIRYNAWLERTKGNFVSLSGQQFVKDIIEIIPDDYIFHEGVFGKEFCIYEDRPMMFDFVVTHPVKRAVEFNGDFWHANPKKYSADDIVPLRGGCKKAKDIWESDSAKIKALNKRGFEVLVVWENEYLKNPNETIAKVAKWITR
jgi:hypothetical protein